MDIEPLVGAADSGDMEADPPRLFQAMAEAALEKGTLNSHKTRWKMSEAHPHREGWLEN
ncbi:MAG: hypothetical protein ACYCY2_04300 [Acidithiobacillus ferriphilus]